MQIRRLIFIGTVILLPWIVLAQSMYSSIGFGDVILPSTSRADGLGVHGVAIPDYQEISIINPAFWHQLEFTGITTRIQSTKLTNSAGGLNYHSAFNGFNFHFPVGDVIGIAFGFAPLSHVNYDFERTGQKVFSDMGGDADTVQYNVDLKGTGGVGGNFFGLGWKVTNHLSLGVAYNILIGQIENRRTLEFTDQNYSSRYIAASENVYGGNLILGFAYSNLLRKSDNIGFRIEVPISLKVLTEDALYNSVTAPDRTTEELTGLKWPLQMSIGYQTHLTGRWLAVSEFNLWSPASDLEKITGDSNFSWSDGLKVGAGIEYASDYSAETWWKTFAWRAGFSLRQYMETDQQSNQPMSTRAMIGMGIPFGDAANRLDLSMQYGRRNGFVENDPVETEISFAIGITVSELWFNGGVRNR